MRLSFDHIAPENLQEALRVLDQLGDQAVLLAGGTDLMLKMKDGSLRPGAVVSIKSVPELKGIRFDHDRGLSLGAATTLRELMRSPILHEHYPCLGFTASLMASAQVRSLATVGGNLCNAAPSADLAPPLLALDAEARLVSPSGERKVDLQSFFLGPGENVLEPGELMLEILVPPPRGKTIYLKHSPRTYMDIATVGVALRVSLEDRHCQEARIALGAVAPVPMRAQQAEAELTNHELTPEYIANAARQASKACAPIDDLRGSAWYRKRMVEALIKRGLERMATLFAEGEPA